jgi:hypothetical protein
VALINNSFPSLYLVSPWQLKICWFETWKRPQYIQAKVHHTTWCKCFVCCQVVSHKCPAMVQPFPIEIIFQPTAEEHILPHEHFFLNLSGTAQQLPKEETVIYPIYWVWHRCYLSSEEIDVFKEMVLLAKYGAGFFFGQGMWHYIPLYTEMVLPSNNDKNWIWTGMLPLQQGHVILQQVAFHILQQYCFCGLNKWLKPDDDSITEHASVWRNNMFILKKRNSNIVLKIQCI